MRTFTMPWAVLLVGVSVASAGPSPLTLQVALNEALVRNPRLTALRREYQALQHRPAQARTLDPPTFEAQIWQWPFNTFDPRNANMYMFSLGQSLPGPGKRGLRAAVAEKDAERSLAVIVLEARDVVDEVKRTYAELSLVRREIEIHHANVGLLRQVADVSEAKYTTGRVGQQDTLKAVVELSRLFEHLVTLTERERLAQARLNTLLDRAPESPIGALLEPREAGVLPPLAELERAALERQPELAVARLDVQRAEAALAAERGESGPDFFVKGGYALMPRRVDSWSAMVGITWPTAPWSRAGLDARVAEAAATVETARARYAAVESAVRLAVHDAYARAEAAQERAVLLRTTIVPQSDHAMAVSQVAYQTDAGDVLMLIDNQRVVFEVQLAYYRALSDLEQARADLEWGVGIDLRSAVRGNPVGETE